MQEAADSGFIRTDSGIKGFSTVNVLRVGNEISNHNDVMISMCNKNEQFILKLYLFQVDILGKFLHCVQLIGQLSECGSEDLEKVSDEAKEFLKSENFDFINQFGRGRGDIGNTANTTNIGNTANTANIGNTDQIGNTNKITNADNITNSDNITNVDNM